MTSTTVFVLSGGIKGDFKGFLGSGFAKPTKEGWVFWGVIADLGGADFPGRFSKNELLVNLDFGLKMGVVFYGGF